MSNIDALVTGYGETRMADEDICIAVGEDLTRMYPGYLWMVGADHDAGVVHIRLQLPLDTPANRVLGEYGYLLYISSVLGAGGQAKVRNAGGEMLERWGLPRSWAPHDVVEIAQAHGLDISGAVTKSKH